VAGDCTPKKIKAGSLAAQPGTRGYFGSPATSLNGDSLRRGVSSARPFCLPACARGRLRRWCGDGEAHFACDIVVPWRFLPPHFSASLYLSCSSQQPFSRCFLKKSK
jgi:hypothetical protein